MSNKDLKRKLGATGDTSKLDIDRIKPKAEGGTYELDNSRLLTPAEHAARHGTLRERSEVLSLLKAVFDERKQVMGLVSKINNQLLAFQRHTDYPHPDTEKTLRNQLEQCEDLLNGIDRKFTTLVKEYAKLDRLTAVTLDVPGVGPVTAGALAVYIELQKAANASSLWKYVGLDKPSHQRYKKGEAGGGNKTLRTVLYNTATSMMKNRECAYRDVYDRAKAQKALSEKIVSGYNTQGKLVEGAWKDAKPSHGHGHALRMIMKHFLADYWFVGRTILGLSTRPLYAEEKLGHTGIIRPRERGWMWQD